MRPWSTITTLVALLLWASPSGLSAAEFDHWFFAFFKGATKSTENYFDAEGNKIDRSEGTLTGKVSEDGTKFVVRMQHSSEKKGKTEATLTWKKIKEGKFRGEYENSKGGRATYLLSFEGDRVFRMTATGSNGMKIVSKGRLGKDGKLRSEEKVWTNNGVLVLRAESKTEKAKPAKVEPAKEPEAG